MATFYVNPSSSPQTLNGVTYGGGSDSNPGTQAQPFQTTAAAVAQSHGTDTINLFPATFSETTPLAGNGNALTLQADQTIGGQATIIQNASQTTIYHSAGAGALYFNNITWDGTNITGGGIEAHAQFATLQNCVFQNFGAGIYTINTTTANWAVTTIKCTWLPSCADGIFIGAASTMGLSVQGCSMSCTDKNFTPGLTSGTVASVAFTTAPDGTPTTINSGIMAYVESGATYTSLQINAVNFSGAARGWYNDPSAGGPGTTTYGSVAVTNCLASGTNWVSQVMHFSNAVCSSWTFTGNNFVSNGGILVTGENASGGVITGNSITNYPAATNDAINVQAGANWAIGTIASPNTIAVNSTAETHGILVGQDGPAIDSTNGTATTTQAIGSSSSNQYVSQGFTTSAITKANRSSYLQGITLTLAANGTGGSGTLSFKVFASSGGAPTGSAIETSPTTILCSSIPGSATTYFIELTNHAAYTPNTVYCLEIQNSANNASNYVLLSVNATTTNGAAYTSSNGSSWSATSTAAIYTVWTGFYGMTGCSVVGNIVTTSATAGTPDNHCIITGCTPYVTVSQNQVFNNGGGPSIGCKDCYGCYVFANVVTVSGTNSTNGGFWNKGSANAYFEQNTISYTGTGGSTAPCAMSFIQDPTIGSVSPKPSNSSFDNNIVYYAPTTSGAFVYNLAWYGTGNTINGNTVYFNGNAAPSASYSTWSLWQGAGYDVNSTNSDPLLPGETGGFTAASSFIPPYTSPAKRAGINTNGDIPKVLDFYGNLFGISPDSGAFNIAITYANNQALPNQYNPLTPGFNWKGLSSVAANAIYAQLNQGIVLTASGTAANTKGEQGVPCDATSGNIILTLQDAVTYDGAVLAIKKIDASANTVTITPTNSQLIYNNGSSASTFLLSYVQQSVRIQAIGGAWRILAQNLSPYAPLTWTGEQTFSAAGTSAAFTTPLTSAGITDSGGALLNNGLTLNAQNIATTGGTLTALTVTSPTITRFTGSTSSTIQPLPTATALAAAANAGNGLIFEFINNASASVSITAGSGTTINGTSNSSFNLASTNNTFVSSVAFAYNATTANWDMIAVSPRNITALTGGLAVSGSTGLTVASGSAFNQTPISETASFTIAGSGCYRLTGTTAAQTGTLTTTSNAGQIIWIINDSNQTWTIAPGAGGTLYSVGVSANITLLANHSVMLMTGNGGGSAIWYGWVN
jgi:hypothetical protein